MRSVKLLDHMMCTLILLGTAFISGFHKLLDCIFSSAANQSFPHFVCFCNTFIRLYVELA